MLETSVEISPQNTKENHSAPEIPSNRHRQIHTVICSLTKQFSRRNKMDKSESLKLMNFAAQAHSAQLLKQQVAQQMIVLANMGITVKSREQRTVGVAYKPNGKRECARRAKQQAALALKKSG